MKHYLTTLITLVLAYGNAKSAENGQGKDPAVRELTLVEMGDITGNFGHCEKCGPKDNPCGYVFGRHPTPACSNQDTEGACDAAYDASSGHTVCPGNDKKFRKCEEDPGAPSSTTCDESAQADCGEADETRCMWNDDEQSCEEVALTFVNLTVRCQTECQP